MAAQFAGGRGQRAFRAVVVDASTGADLFGSGTHLVNMPGGHVNVTVLLRMVDCTLPHAGVYIVQMFCDADFVDDRRITLI